MVIAFAFHQVSDYEKEIEIMETMSQDEFVAYIRRSVIKLENKLCDTYSCNFINCHVIFL
jgi:hypothetical protein